MGDPMCMCPLIHEPVCCGGEDYSSGCVYECEVDGGDADNDCQAGACPNDECICTMEYNPVCCRENGKNTGTTYGNPCMASCGQDDAALLHCYYGECPECPMTLENDPYCCGNVQYGNPSEVGCAGLSISDCTKGECPSSGSVTNAEFAAYGDAALSDSSSYDDDYDDAYYEDQAVDRGYNDNENMYNAYNDNQRYYEEDEQFAGNNNKRSNSDDDRNGNNRNGGYSKSGNRNKGYSKSANNRNSASNNRNHKFAGYGVDATTDDIFNAYEEQQVVAGKKGKSKSSSKSKSKGKGKGKKKSSSKKKNHHRSPNLKVKRNRNLLRRKNINLQDMELMQRQMIPLMHTVNKKMFRL